MKTIEGNFQNANGKYAILVGRFNSFVVEALLQGSLDTLKRHGVTDENITIVRAPGAWELPLVAKKLAEKKHYDAIIALGAVIRGQTYHFELVSNESGAGISRVGLDYGIPIANGVLTCETDEQAQARVLEKGRDCARTAVEMANLSIGLTPDDEVEED